MAGVIEYDPITGQPFTYETQSPTVEGPYAGDSGFPYADKVIDLLKFGIQTTQERKRYEFDAARRYELGRAGLTAQGVPVGTVTLGGSTISPGAIMLGLVVAGVVAYLALK
jgi:hypothetical protein